MRKLSLLLLKAFIGPFIITFVIALFVLEMQFIWLYLDDIMGKGLSGWVILQLLVYASARIINLALPLAILMSSIMTMGNLAEHYELTSMKSAGISLFRVLRPLTVMIVIVAASAFFFANNIWPIATLKYRALLTSIVHQRPALNLSERVFYNGIEGVSIRVMEKNEQTGEIRDVLIYDHTQSAGSRRVIRAEYGTMAQTEDRRYLVLTLYNGNSYDEALEKGRKKEKLYPHTSSAFEKDILRIDLASLFFEKVDESLTGKPEEMMTVVQLTHAVDSLEDARLKHLEDLADYLAKQKLPEKEDRRVKTLGTLTDTTQTRDTTTTLLTDTVELPPGAIDAEPATGEPASGDVEAETNAETYLNSAGEHVGYFASLSPAQRTRALDITSKILRSQKVFIENTVVREMKSKKREANNYRIEFHRKFFFAFSCVILFFIGAPLGAIIRKGGIALPAVVALCLFILYYILTISGEKMTDAGTVKPWLGMWFGSFVLIPMAVFLTYKAGTDSAVMDREVYSRAWNKFVGLFKRRKKKSTVESPPALS